MAPDGKCDCKVGRLFCLINTPESHKQVLFPSKEEAWEAGGVVLGIPPPLGAAPRETFSRAQDTLLLRASQTKRMWCSLKTDLIFSEIPRISLGKG